MSNRQHARATYALRRWAMTAACLWAGGAWAVPVTGPTVLTVFSGNGPGAPIDLVLSATGSIYMDFQAAGIDGLTVTSLTAPGTVSIDTGNVSGIAWPHGTGDVDFGTDSTSFEVDGDVLLTPFAAGLGGTWNGATLSLAAGADIFIWNLGDGLGVAATGTGLVVGTVTTGGGGGGTTVGGGGGGVVVGGGGATLSLPAPATLAMVMTGGVLLAGGRRRRRAAARRRTSGGARGERHRG